MNLFSDPTKHGRRGFLTLTSAALAGATVHSQGRVPLAQTQSPVPFDEVSPADSLVLYLNLLDGVHQSVIQVQLKELSDLKDRVSESLGRIISQAQQVREGRSDTERTTRLLDTIERTKELHKKFEDERHRRLEEIEALGPKINDIKDKLVQSCASLKGFTLPNSGSESVQSSVTQGAVKAASQSLKDAVGLIEKLAPSSRAGTVNTYEAETLILILEAADRAINGQTKSGPAKPDQIEQAHPTARMTVSQAHEQVKQIIRANFPPASFFQVATGLFAVWPILWGVSDPSERKRPLLRCLRLISSNNRANPEAAATEISKITL